MIDSLSWGYILLDSSVLLFLLTTQHSLEFQAYFLRPGIEAIPSITTTTTCSLAMVAWQWSYKGTGTIMTGCTSLH